MYNPTIYPSQPFIYGDHEVQESHTELTTVKARLAVVTFVIRATPTWLLTIKVAIDVPRMKSDKETLMRKRRFGLFTTFAYSPHKRYIRKDARRIKTESGRSENILKMSY